MNLFKINIAMHAVVEAIRSSNTFAIPTYWRRHAKPVLCPVQHSLLSMAVVNAGIALSMDFRYRPNVVRSDGVLASPLDGAWRPVQVDGSFYRTVAGAAEK